MNISLAETIPEFREIKSEEGNVSKDISRQVYDSSECAKIFPNLPGSSLLYVYSESKSNWRLCIATRGKIGSGQLSLGGFRIIPMEREKMIGFSPEKEALGLASGMEEKVYWSKLLKIAGPLGINHLNRVVGGKCVLLPTVDSRIGQPRDKEMLDFAATCLQDFEQHSGILITTGQDLGHGVMSDGSTSSLRYLSSKFKGSVMADTSQPTAEGNLFTLLGMLKGVNINPKDTKLGLIGHGNIGRHLLDRLLEVFGKNFVKQVYVLESDPIKRQNLEELGVRVFQPEQKPEFLRQPMDGLVLNASGNSLDSETVGLVTENETIKVLCGCENLVMPNQSDSLRLARAKKIYCPTELCGMMGYLTAVEEYLSTGQGKQFELEGVLVAAKQLENIAYEVSRLIETKRPEVLTFEDGVKLIYGELQAL